MTDLVKLLREAAMSWRTPDRLVCDRAADRIEKLETNFQNQLEWYLSNKRVLDDRIKKLEAALREIVDLSKGMSYLLGFTPADIARKALEGKDD